LFRKKINILSLPGIFSTLLALSFFSL